MRELDLMFVKICLIRQAGTVFLANQPSASPPLMLGEVAKESEKQSRQNKALPFAEFRIRASVVTDQPPQRCSIQVPVVPRIELEHLTPVHKGKSR